MNPKSTDYEADAQTTTPSHQSKKCAYADDLAIFYLSGDWKVLEKTLSEDMTTLSAYLQTWRLKFSRAKTVKVAFHLHSREAKRKLKDNNNSKVLTFSPSADLS